MSLRNRFWMLSLGLVLSTGLLLLLVLTLVITPPVAKRLVQMDEERRLSRLVISGEWRNQSLEEARPSERSVVFVPTPDGRFLVSRREQSFREAVKVVKPSGPRLLGGFFLWLGFTYLLATLLSRLVSRPLKELLEAVRALASGEREVKVPLPAEVELAELAGSFNTMADKLTQRENDLEQALASKERLFASTSHELRTPLTLILGYCQMLEDGLKGELSEEQAKALAVIHRNADELLEQVETLLTGSQLEAGSLAVRLERTDLRDLVHQWVEDLGPLASEKSLSLELDLPEQEVEVDIDPRLARQIVRNLVVNAVKYTPEGIVKVEVSRFEGKARVSVRDTGPGITVGFEERIFQEYSRAENTEGVEGTGLGLALAQRLAKAMGGEVKLLENGPRGATFCWEQLGSRA